MDISGFHKLLEAWTEGGRFGEPIMTISEILALTICVFYSIKTRIGKVFFFYILFDFLIALIDYYLMYFSEVSKKQRADFIHISNASVSAVELCVYYYFFFQILQNLTIKHVMKFFSIIFAIFYAALIIFAKDYSYRRISGIIGAIEFVFLLLPCFTYYFELFSIKTSKGLLNRPSFWIVTGIFFYSTVSIPYYLIENFLQENQYHSRTLLAVFMFYIPFSFNFLFLTKAFLCKKALTI